jgi:hypothetical protein
MGAGHRAHIGSERDITSGVIARAGGIEHGHDARDSRMLVDVSAASGHPR